MSNPSSRNGKWYFYDETYDEHGPYPTKDKAESELSLYGVYLNDGPKGLCKELRKRWEDAEQACEDITESLTSECRRLDGELKKAKAELAEAKKMKDRREPVFRKLCGNCKWRSLTAMTIINSCKNLQSQYYQRGVAPRNTCNAWEERLDTEIQEIKLRG